MGKFRKDRVQSHMWLTASSYMVKYLLISLYIRKPFLTLEFPNIYEKNILFFFISVICISKRESVMLFYKFVVWF